MNTIPKVERCFSSSVTVTEQGVRLPYTPAVAVMLSNWNVNNDPALGLKSGSGSASLVQDDLDEVYWGFGGVYAHQLFASDCSVIIPVTNLQDICLRARAGQRVTIWYSYWQ